jgi:hypothetical protein
VTRFALLALSLGLAVAVELLDSARLQVDYWRGKPSKPRTYPIDAPRRCSHGKALDEPCERCTFGDKPRHDNGASGRFGG